MISMYTYAARKTGKDRLSIKRFIERKVMFPDLVEIAQEHGEQKMFDTLVELVNRYAKQIRNKRKS